MAEQTLFPSTYQRWRLVICVVGYTVVFWGKAAVLEVM